MSEQKQLGIACGTPVVMLLMAMGASSVGTTNEQPAAVAVSEAHQSFQAQVETPAEEVVAVTSFKPSQSVASSEADNAPSIKELVPEAATADDVEPATPVSYEVVETNEPVAKQLQADPLDSAPALIEPDVSLADFPAKVDPEPASAPEESDVLVETAASPSESEVQSALDPLPADPPAISSIASADPLPAEAPAATETSVTSIAEPSTDPAPSAPPASTSVSSDPLPSAPPIETVTSTSTDPLPAVPPAPSVTAASEPTDVLPDVVEAATPLPMTSTSTSSVVGPTVSLPSGKPFLGVGIRNPADNKVTTVYAGSTAANLGVKLGDRLTAANGKPVVDITSLRSALSGLVVSDDMTVEVIRDGKLLSLGPLPLGAR